MSILEDEGAWETWFNREIKPIVEPAWFELCRAVEGRLDSLGSEATSLEGLTRDRWLVFAPFPIKSAARVRTKLLAAGGCEDGELREYVLRLGDLARLRIVATLKRDVMCCRGALVSADQRTFLTGFPILELKDFVRDENLRKPLVGHRALQVVVEVPGDGNTVRVEVQIMTQLQHTWDRRNHPMYEWLREHREQRSPEIDDLRIDDHAVAESLHALDALADHNFATFLRLWSRR